MIADSTRRDQDRRKQAGMDAFLTEPIQIGAAIHAIDE